MLLLFGTYWTLVCEPGSSLLASGITPQDCIAPSLVSRPLRAMPCGGGGTVFGFGEMTLTPVDYAVITGLCFTSPAPPLDARYHTATLRAQLVWSYEYCIYPGGPSGDSPVEARRIPCYPSHCHHTYASGEDPEYWRSFLNNRELSDMSTQIF
ncbi:hypothetical protein JCGZ_25420 [Jatropha curcas]|uniref:Xylanase inhibitor N-terminal domain-containing protein n=1 Tax=Jatropha curcas TaxID=180498 RepID=A0A067JLE3_JATCU|nr:hypothetical protein JCGZ_25420 [Jatropha curcas]